MRIYIKKILEKKTYPTQVEVEKLETRIMRISNEVDKLNIEEDLIREKLAGKKRLGANRKSALSLADRKSSSEGIK